MCVSSGILRSLERGCPAKRPDDASPVPDDPARACSWAARFEPRVQLGASRYDVRVQREVECAIAARQDLRRRSRSDARLSGGIAREAIDFDFRTRRVLVLDLERVGRRD